MMGAPLSLGSGRVFLVVAVAAAQLATVCCFSAAFHMPIGLKPAKYANPVFNHLHPSKRPNHLRELRTARPLQHHSGSSLKMALGPVGPLCPFQSSYMQSDEIEKGMESFMEGGNDFYGPYMRFMLSIQAQELPPKEEVANLAQQMEKFNDNWRVLMTRFQLAPDFQAQQLWKFMGAFLETQGISFAQQLKANEWQLELPPELEPIMKNPQANGPIPSAFLDDGFSPGITATPFNSDALQSEVVKEELGKLIKDHKMMVKMGEQYGKWDREGKKMYIDQLEAVEERWDIFQKRFELMGEQNPMFTEQAQAYLSKLNITPEEFREMNTRVRQQMREDAEKQ